MGVLSVVFLGVSFVEACEHLYLKHLHGFIHKPVDGSENFLLTLPGATKYPSLETAALSPLSIHGHPPFKVPKCCSPSQCSPVSLGITIS